MQCPVKTQTTDKRDKTFLTYADKICNEFQIIILGKTLLNTCVCLLVVHSTFVNIDLAKSKVQYLCCLSIPDNCGATHTIPANNHSQPIQTTITENPFQ